MDSVGIAGVRSELFGSGRNFLPGDQIAEYDSDERGRSEAPESFDNYIER